MSQIKRTVSLTHIKENAICVSQVSEQTKKNRDKINSKIRVLGDKYYKTKAFFDRLNIRRDNLFSIGKQLEKKYRNIKKGIHLQAQTKRMKEALYCWYAENFYDEIFNGNSLFLEAIQPNSMNEMQQTENCQQQMYYVGSQINLKESVFPIGNEEIKNQILQQSIPKPNETSSQASELQKSNLEENNNTFNISEIFKEIEQNSYNNINFEESDIFYYEF